MKKLTLLFAFILFVATKSHAQMGGVPAMEVQESQFTSNPTSFIGKTIKIKNISITMSDGPATTAPGAKPCNPPSPGSKMIKLEFANPNFKGCFEISQALSNAIPKNLECIGNVIIKVDAVGNYKILDCKVQP